MKKAILQIIMILVVITLLSFVNVLNVANAESKAGLSIPSSVKEGEEFTVSLILPSGAYAAQCDIKATFSDGTVSTGKLVYVEGMSSSPNSVKLKANKAGTCTVSATNIIISDSAANKVENGGSKSGTLNVTGNTSQTPAQPTPAPTPAPSTPTSTVKWTDSNDQVKATENVKLRKSPVDGAVITTIPKGTQFTRQSYGDNGWSKVTYNGQTGYVSSSYVTVVTAQSSNTSAPAQQPSTTNGWIYTNDQVKTTENVKFRKSPINGEVITTIKAGIQFTRVSYNTNGWSQVTYNGQTGYVSSSYITVVTAQPSNTTTPAQQPTTTDGVKWTDSNDKVKTTESVKFREAPSDGKVISTLPAGTELLRQSYGSNDWSKVTYNGKTGYVHSKYLSVIPKTDDKEQDDSQDPEKVECKNVDKTMYATQDCNVRKINNTSSDKVGYLVKNQEVKVTGTTTNGWSRIDYKGKKAFVATRLLADEKIEEVEEEKEEPKQEETPEVVDQATLIKEEVGVLPAVGVNLADIIEMVSVIASMCVLVGSFAYIYKK